MPILGLRIVLNTRMTYDDYIESSNFEIDELDDIEEQLDIETEPERKKTKR